MNESDLCARRACGRDGDRQVLICVQMQTLDRLLVELGALCAAILVVSISWHLRLRRRHALQEPSLDGTAVFDGLLPICAWCKRARDRAGRWRRVEASLEETMAARQTHSICPDCTARMFDEV